ncbi:aromatic acid exporter family protein [Saccharopolyspora gloriosae]|uniref:Putative membrane protein n=1 Tax=Saccharopolyspora gloriosae TaxID=455344 RepID=A0A840N8K8_9PSEU|nr:putative membrane protein [Saccharopolyspora gloriosae]
MNGSQTNRKSTDDVGGHRDGGHLRKGWQRLRSLVRRGIGHAGPDRDAMLLIVKSVIAATAGWLIANNLLGAPSATFAPFTALLMVQATISQSLDQSARYAGAMVVGVVLAGLVTPLLGAATLTFALLMLVALVLGRWRRLGAQGPQVGVAALFAYSSFTQSGNSLSSFVQLGSIAGLVLLGCVLGVLTNLLVVPPMRYRSAEYGIESVAHTLCDLTTDVSDGLREGVPSAEDAAEWRHRADQLPEIVTQARSSVEHAAETTRFNPRRLLFSQKPSFDGHRSSVNALERAVEQLRSAMRGLTYAAEADDPQEQQHEFARDFGALLREVAGAARAAGDVHGNDNHDELDRLGEATENARERYRALVARTEDRQLDRPDQWPVYGALQTDAQRLVEEFVQAYDNLAELMRGTGSPTGGEGATAEGGPAGR